MKKELDEKLVKDFPLLFADRGASMHKTCMCWGFSCGDGWYDLIREAAEQLELIIAQLKKGNPGDKYLPRASQVKEKFGTLRFYMSSETEEMDKIIGIAEEKSSVTCEDCGSTGELRGEGWYVTICEACDKRRKEDARKTYND